MTHPTAREVLALLEAGLAMASAMNEPSCMAVVDAGGNLMGFIRSDEAQFGTIEIAINKAWTASAFRMATADLAPDVLPGASSMASKAPARGPSSPSAAACRSSGAANASAALACQVARWRPM